MAKIRKNMFRNNDIIHTENIKKELKEYFQEFKNKKICILTDNNCKRDCYPIIEDLFKKDIFLFEIEEGEQNKTLKTVELIWNFLIENNFNRNSLIINLGGGVLTDIGGFAASTFKRGIRFINIPTTLLAQIDASVGGKTGINYNGLKNEIGMFSLPDKVFISPIFLNTLDSREFLSGFAEMIKHALIYDESHLHELKEFILHDYKDQGLIEFLPLIKKSVSIKETFVEKDINDRGIRKVLNLGHTFGHAFESFFNTKNKQNIRHGEAVALGIICELYISSVNTSFNKNSLSEISEFILSVYDPVTIPEESFEKVYDLMLHDKKNDESGINCILLEKTGSAVYDKNIEKKEIFEALYHLNKICIS